VREVGTCIVASADGVPRTLFVTVEDTATDVDPTPTPSDELLARLTTQPTGEQLRARALIETYYELERNLESYDIFLDAPTPFTDAEEPVVKATSGIPF
jgi:hypothetical protein